MAEQKEKEEKEKALSETGEDKENQKQPGFDRRWYTDINERWEM